MKGLTLHNVLMKGLTFHNVLMKGLTLFVPQCVKIAYFHRKCSESNKILLALVSIKPIAGLLLFAVFISY